ncbi:fimbrial biogenesis chaperone [Burkholderia pyrrocinia]|uniref:Molecular chaperone n=1 Tax=Burkholderia pyrrocinia TaxID=60550 RepID=A0ABZ3BN16_BURPY
MESDSCWNKGQAVHAYVLSFFRLPMGIGLPMVRRTLILKIFILTIVAHSAFAVADLSFDGQNRFIMTGKRMKVDIVNEGDGDALADVSVTWGDEKTKKDLPLVISRPLLKISPKGRGSVDIIYQGIGFPADRESYMLLNVLDVPTVPHDPNVLQIALRHRLKLFYRPALKETLDDAMAALSWELRNEGGRVISAYNPSAYYLTLSDITFVDRSGNGCAESIEHLMIAPFSSALLEISSCNSTDFRFNVISDAGYARPYRVKLIFGENNTGLRQD